MINIAPLRTAHCLDSVYHPSLSNQAKTALSTILLHDYRHQEGPLCESLFLDLPRLGPRPERGPAPLQCGHPLFARALWPSPLFLSFLNFTSEVLGSRGKPRRNSCRAQETIFQPLLVPAWPNSPLESLTERQRAGSRVVPSAPPWEPSSQLRRASFLNGLSGLKASSQ